MTPRSRSRRWLIAAASTITLIASTAVPAGAAPAQKPTFTPHWTAAAAHDTSPTLRSLAANHTNPHLADGPDSPRENRAEEVPDHPDNGFTGDPTTQDALPAAQVGSTIRNFEGLSNTDNFNLFGFRVNPPDPVGDVGPTQYVEMVNLAFAVYSKTGSLLLGPVDTGALWDGFPIEDCTDPSGDPVVLYDQLADRWILTQFTTRGLDDPSLPFYNCMAISTTGDATGSYYRYAFTTGLNFPDYPKYGVWTDSYVITTREFGPTIEYGIGVYALEKNKMINGQDARVASFFIDGNNPDLLPLVGDGLLPADIDGKQKPKTDTAIPLVGTQDDGFVYGATFDAAEHLGPPREMELACDRVARAQHAAPYGVVRLGLPVRSRLRDCLPQPGITNPAQFLDILSFRQRPTWRLAYRNFKGYETLVTNQSVEAPPGVAGVRWYEIRRNPTRRVYSMFQQGTYAPNDGVHRWMGSIAQDKKGNMALGYSVVNATTVFPGIRYTGRLAGDTLGDMTLGEGTIVNGTGVQTTTNSRWGDYTSMNVDPVDDCTFWYVNEYYTAAGQASSLAGWQTRIASFKLPGC